jgi:transcriptional regulator with XRE-family HTH domain
MSVKNPLGEKINQLRQSREMSQEELAKASNNDVELIDKLENGALVPSLTPLFNIARALGVRLGTFLDDAPQNGPVLVESGKSKHVVRFSGKCSNCKESSLEFNSLAADKQDRHMEPFIIDVHPQKGEHPLSSHEGEEFIYVLEGEIEILYGKETYNLEAGDSIYYDSVVPHDLHAVDEDAKIMAVVYTPY